MTAVLRRLMAIGPPAWGRLAVAIGLGVAGGLATLGLLAGSGYVVDKAALRPGLGAIAGVLAGVEVLAFLRGPLRYGERLQGHDAAFQALGRWRLWLFDRLEPRSPAGLMAWRSGDLLTRATNDVDVAPDLYLRILLPVVVTSAVAVVAVVVVALILPLAGLILGLALALALFLSPVVAALTGPRRGRQQELMGRLSAEIVELLQAAPDLVAYGQDVAARQRIEDLDRSLTRLARRRALAAGATSALVVLCLGGAVIGVLAAGVAAVHAGHLSPVMVGVLPLAAIGAFETVPALGGAALRAAEVAESARRLLEVDEVPVPLVDPASPRAVPTGVPSVEFAGARLRYRPDLPWALDGLDLTLAPGSRTALVGPSGAGKSSLVNVLLRFWPLSSGRATLSSAGLDELRQDEVRANVAWVEQDPYLFAGTIRRNLLLGRPDAGADDVAGALGQAQLTAWVASLPAGLETEIGEAGLKVSGGQRQRIALARALLGGGDLLVLDEPTAGLDRATGEQLLADVLEAAPDKTVLLITHRRAEGARFEQVIEMQDGRAVEISGRRHPEDEQRQVVGDPPGAEGLDGP